MVDMKENKNKLIFIIGSTPFLDYLFGTMSTTEFKFAPFHITNEEKKTT